MKYFFKYEIKFWFAFIFLSKGPSGISSKEMNKKGEKKDQKGQQSTTIYQKVPKSTNKYQEVSKCTKKQKKSIKKV